METPFLDQLIDEHQNHIESVEASSYAGIQETRKQLAELEAIKAIIVTHCCTELICDFDNINDGSLTKGKKYAKIHEHNGMVVIINDFDEVMSYNKEAFFEAN